MKIPEDLSALKRPALQALCKKMGIKANGKNTDMIKALESYTDSSKQENDSSDCMPSDGMVSMETASSQETFSDVPEPHPSPVATSVEKKAPKVVRKKGGRKGSKKRKTTRRGSKKESNTSSSTESEATTDSAIEDSVTMTTPVEDSIPQKTLTEDSMKSAESNPSNQLTSRKRKRRDTHSISPNSSLCSAVKIPRLSADADTAQSIADTTTQLTSPCQETQMTTIENEDSNTHICPISEDTHTMGLATDNENSTTNDSNEQAELRESSIDSRPPFSPPSECGSASGSSRKRKRHSTFIVSPSQKEAMLEGGVETGKEESEERRLTFDLVPNTSFGPASDELVSSTSNKTENACDVMTELQNILDKKVTEIKSAPDYKPEHSAASTLATRLPVKSNIQKKFDKAHSKNFNKMKSIQDHQNEKKRKQSQFSGTGVGPSSAKKPRLENSKSLTQRPGSRLPTALKHSHTTATHKSPQKRRTISKSTALNSAEHKPDVFKPSVTSVKKANLRFSEQPRSTTKVAGSQTKTPKKVTLVTGGKTPSQTKRPVYNLQESLKKKPISYKPYAGPLPKFGAQH